MASCAMTIVAAFEIGMVYAVRPSHERGNEGGAIFFGVLSSVLISAGLLPQYYEIYKHKEVIGVSMVFMGIDILGGKSVMHPYVSPE